MNCKPQSVAEAEAEVVVVVVETEATGWFCSFVPCCVGLTVNTLKTGALEEPTAADVEHDAAVVLHFWLGTRRRGSQKRGDKY